jgi:quinol monooxygenase YgiN
MSNVIVVATLQAKPGSEEAAQALLTETIEATHQEEGCITYALHVSKSDPAQFVIVERWESQEALEAHGATPHMAHLASAARDLFAARPIIIFTDAIPVGDPAKGSLAGA